MTDRVFGFGGFRLDASRRLLFGVDGEPVPLNSRAFDTLAYLVEHSQQLLDKATLLAAIWPNTVVEDNNLNQCIWALRRALGERPGEHRFIVTVPGRGFRFVATVERLASEPEVAAPAIAASPSPLEPAPYTAPMDLPAVVPTQWHIRLAAVAGMLLLATVVGLTATRPGARSSPPSLVRSSELSPAIAVLPFTDLSPARDQETFADGLSEELLGQLDDQPGIAVIGRSSSFAFKGKHEDLRRVGRELGADYLMEGSVRRVDERLRVTIHLVETVRGRRIWSDTYERKAGDILALQDEMARDMAPEIARRVASTTQAQTGAAAAR